jgi:RimJ/RimL family protein N-acetyltransferase
MIKEIKHFTLDSERLKICPIELKDADFILKLFNTEGWLQFIGDRNIRTVHDAENFIKNALVNDHAALWIVNLLQLKKSIGLITLIKREYLNYPDVGYALMPNEMGRGYSTEATQAVINKIKFGNYLEKLNAITLRNNSASINLLKRLSFKFDKEIEANEETLHLYQLEFAT